MRSQGREWHDLGHDEDAKSQTLSESPYRAKERKVIYFNKYVDVRREFVRFSHDNEPPQHSPHSMEPNFQNIPESSKPSFDARKRKSERFSF